MGDDDGDCGHGGENDGGDDRSDEGFVISVWW
jgi:hypothetical protein